MATQVNTTAAKATSTTYTLANAHATSGVGAPVHRPSIAFQIYTDSATGKSYLWTGDKWS